jgi:hypothetical protein
MKYLRQSVKQMAEEEPGALPGRVIVCVMSIDQNRKARFVGKSKNINSIEVINS